MRELLKALNSNCSFKHSWNKWQAIYHGEISNRSGNVIGYSTIQERHCSKCNKIQQNVIKSVAI